MAQPPSPPHSNLYVRNIPPDMDERSLQELFSSFGKIVSVRLVRNHNPLAHNFAFVKFESVEQAHKAILNSNGAQVGNSILEVKFADSDAHSGEVPPNDNLYVRNLPSTYTEEDLKQLFSSFGTVVCCRILHRGDMSIGVDGLIRMSTIDEATKAIEGLLNRTPLAGTLPLVVRYADSAEQKAKRLAKNSTKGPPRYKPYTLPPSPTPLAAPTGLGPAGQLGQQVTAATASLLTAATARNDSTALPFSYAVVTTEPLSVQAAVQQLYSDHQGFHDVTNLSQALLPNGISNNVQTVAAVNSLLGSAANAPNSGSALSASIYIKHLPAEADKLFLYEKFAPFGGVLSVKVLLDEQTGKCKGVGFVNYADPAAAAQAVQAMNNLPLGTRRLHVSIQTYRTR